MFRVIILFIFLFSACQMDQEPDLQSQLIGKWEDVFEDSHRIEFAPNGDFTRYREGQTLDISTTTFFEENDNGELLEVNYGQLKYHIHAIQADSIYYSLIGSENNKIYSTGIFLLRQNELLEITYKTLHGIRDHIDEISVYKKVSTTLAPSTPEIVEKIILPEGFIGNIYIAYNQVDGEAISLDSLGNPVLLIPENGRLKTQLSEDPFRLAKQQYEFYERDSITHELSRITVFQHGDLRAIQRKINTGKENVHLYYDLEDTALFVYGFNQVGREYLEQDVFQQRLDGNVLSLEMDTIKERLRIEWYSEKIKN